MRESRFDSDVMEGPPGSPANSRLATHGPLGNTSRLRRTPALRDLVRESELAPGRLIQPVFIAPNAVEPEAVGSLPGMWRYPVGDALDRAIDRLQAVGIRTVLLFGGAQAKDSTASDAYAEDGALQRAIRRIKHRAPDVVVIADLCLCAYTTNGHCWLLHEPTVSSNGAPNELDRLGTLTTLARVALSLAGAGADVLAPSGMVDGMVQTIRRALDANGFDDRVVLSYAVKYASALYGPFREAVRGAALHIDRRRYQMNPANRRDAIREVELDAAEGADIVMVKPALGYLDVISAVRSATRLPLFGYSVSGEYAMIVAAAREGWVDERAAVLELLSGIRRAGADAIITYHAADAAVWLREAGGLA